MCVCMLRGMILWEDKLVKSEPGERCRTRSLGRQAADKGHQHTEGSLWPEGTLSMLGWATGVTDGRCSCLMPSIFLTQVRSGAGSWLTGPRGQVGGSSRWGTGPRKNWQMCVLCLRSE